MKKIAIFASGNGSNAENIIRYFEHHASVHVSVVATNNSNAKVLKRVKKYKVNNAYDFISLPDNWVRKKMSVVGLRLKKELEGSIKEKNI